MLTVDLVDSKLRVKVVPSDKFQFDKDRLKKIPTRRSIWVKDEDGEQIFSHWEIDAVELGSLLCIFDEKELIPTKPVREAIEKHKQDTLLPQDLEKVEGDFEFGLIPDADQESYIRLNPAKRAMLLAFDPGVGKSFPALGRIEALGMGKTIIVGPKGACKKAWPRHVRKVLDLPCLFYHGDIAKRAKLKQQIKDFQIISVPYTMVEEILDIGFDHIILDEAHLISRTNTQAYKDFVKLLEANPKATLQLLTGTPAMKDIVDLWTPVHLISPTIAGSKRAWQERYEEVLFSIKKTIKQRLKDGRVVDRIIDIPIKKRTRNLDELQRRLAPIMVRVKRKSNFKETTKIVKVPMTDRQYELYQMIKAHLIVDLEERSIDTKEAFQQITRLRQVAEGAYTIEPKWQDSGKLDYATRKIDEKLAKGEKVVVWSAFKEGLNILHKRYAGKAVLYTGDVSDSKKDLAHWAFQGVDTDDDAAEYQRLLKYNKDWKFKPGGASIILITLDHRQGIGTDYDAASYQLALSYHWNYNVNKQAFDRLHRRNQKAPEVVTEIIVSEETIDPVAWQKIFQQGEANADAIDGRESVTSSQIREMIALVKSE